MWRVANSSKLVECCKCSSLNLLGLWRFSILAALWWKQTWRLGASSSWKALTTRGGRAFWEMLSLRVALVAVGNPAKSPLPRLTSNYSNPACVGVLCAGRICSACPRYTVSESLKSNKDRQLQFHLWGVCQTKRSQSFEKLYLVVCHNILSSVVRQRPILPRPCLEATLQETMKVNQLSYY